MLLWFNLLGSSPNVNAASFIIINLLLKKNIISKIIYLDINPTDWKTQINEELRNVHHAKSTYAIISKLYDNVNDEELSSINNYIRQVGNDFVIPRAFYVIDNSDKKDYMKEYNQINQVFNVNDSLSIHKENMEIYTENIFHYY